MPDIVHNFPIKAPADQVFQAISTPTGLDTWWTNRASGEPKEGAKYELWFGPDYDWRAVVSRFVPQTEFESRFRFYPQLALWATAISLASPTGLSLLTD